MILSKKDLRVLFSDSRVVHNGISKQPRGDLLIPFLFPVTEERCGEHAKGTNHCARDFLLKVYLGRFFVLEIWIIGIIAN